MNSYIYLFFSGILIGICMILPGISGSVIAIILGIYEEILSLFSNNFNVHYKIKKLLPIATGMIIGIFIFGKILLFFFDKYNFYMLYAFIGIIFGGIPILYSQIKKSAGKIYYFELIISFFISIVIFIIPKLFNVNIYNNFNIISLFFAGVLYISGKIIPGISSSIFLMIFGLYELFLKIITNPLDINIFIITKLFPFFIGIIVGLLLLMRTMNYLFNNYYSKTYSAIIGFVFGSTFSIFPGIKFNIDGLFSLFLMLISFELIYKLSKK